jgi:transposase-like protein
MMHAKTAADVLARRKAFLARWKLRCRAVADSLEEAGERLFTFLRYPPEQWRSLRATDEIDKCFVSAGAMMFAALVHGWTGLQPVWPNAVGSC